MRNAGIPLLVWLAATFLASSPMVSAQSYSVIDLKSLPGAYSTVPGGLNESSQVVGVSGTNSVTDAFVWTPGKGMQNLGSGSAGAINKQGDVVGVTYQGGDPYHAFLWKHDGTMQDLGTLGGGYSSADGVNSNDWIVGTSSLNDSFQGPAFLWTPDGGMQNLGTLGGSQAVATGINDSGVVAGWSSTAKPNIHDAFRWTQGGGMQSLGAGYAYAINASGQIAGSAWSSNKAVLWNPDGSMTKLGVLGGTYSFASALNDSGTVVGQSDTTASGPHAFVWTVKGGMQDLNALIPANFQSQWTLYSSVAVNNAGQIAVFVVPVNGSHVQHALLLSPLMKVAETSSVNPSVVGQAVTFIATITSIVGAPPNGETVSFKNAQNVVLGTGTISGGVAQFTTSSLTEGTHYITAVYDGDVNYASAKSAAVTQVVNK